jgi:hypothetical protein
VVEESDRAVVCNRFRARGRQSGVEVEERFFQALRFRDGKVRWWAFYPSRTEALEAVGLSEQDTHADVSACRILRGRCRRRTWNWCGEESRP